MKPPPASARWAVFGFGVVAYLVGLGALAALALVMRGLGPFDRAFAQAGGKLTGGASGTPDLALALLVDVGLLAGFGLQHSVMARPRFKAFVCRMLPAAAERSAFILATGVVLLALVGLWQPWPKMVWSVDAPVLRWGLHGLSALGWGYLVVASFAINHWEFFGLEQVYDYLRGRPLRTTPFQERWMYRFDRHPIMTGLLFGMWANPSMTLDQLVLVLGFTIYIVIGVSLEERGLRRQWGPAYDDYRSRVGSIVPTFKTRPGQ